MEQYKEFVEMLDNLASMRAGNQELLLQEYIKKIGVNGILDALEGRTRDCYSNQKKQ